MTLMRRRQNSMGLNWAHGPGDQGTVRTPDVLRNYSPFVLCTHEHVEIAFSQIHAHCLLCALCFFAYDGCKSHELPEQAKFVAQATLDLLAWKTDLFGDSCYGYCVLCVLCVLLGIDSSPP